MNQNNLFLKLQFFKYVPNTYNQCLICNELVCLQETNQQFETKINEHLLSFYHLKAQKEILDKTGFLQTQTSINHESERQSYPLYDLQIARELNQIGLNLYFSNCILKIDNFLSKKQSTQKEYGIILKRFYHVLFIHQTNQISDQIIIKFLQNEEYRHDSISALRLLAKQAGHQISLQVQNNIQIEKKNQLKKNKKKAQFELLCCIQFLELLLRNLNYNLAFLLLLLFELDLELSCISILTFQDVLSDKIEINKEKFDKLRTKMVLIGKSLQQAAKITLKVLGLPLSSPIFPLIKNYRDIQSLLEKLKKEYKFQLEAYNEETKQFIQNFHLSVIKFIKKSIQPSKQIQSFLESQVTNHENNNKQSDAAFPALFEIFFAYFESIKQKQIIGNSKVNSIIDNNVFKKRSKSELQIIRNRNIEQMREATEIVIPLEQFCQDQQYQNHNSLIGHQVLEKKIKVDKSQQNSQNQDPSLVISD